MTLVHLVCGCVGRLRGIGIWHATCPNPRLLVMQLLKTQQTGTAIDQLVLDHVGFAPIKALLLLHLLYGND